MIIIQPIGGLCNRMRAINSAYMLAKERDDSLTVIWFNNPELNCPFHELFLPNANFKVVDIYSKWNLKKLWYQLCFSFVSNEAIKAHKGDGLLDEAYRKGLPKNIYIATEEHFYPCHEYDLFIPTKVLQAQINKLTHSFGSHPVGVHIRRTDNKPAIDKSSTNAFVQAMKKELEAFPDTMFYLATDDLSEEEQLREIFPERIISNENRDLSRNSVSGIKDALVDLWCLSNTAMIIGSYFSSFTDIAADLKGIPKIIAGAKET
ncbi:MAG: hypothetical protein NC412_03810 [Roseburia sp.]|nr:hypothetical protein [Roseburia sp.]MCM1278276.1 hypothetical protein [Robinsoniella sp.]